ncbi:hypothetical protein BAE44_0000977 [Dichanthelium oligosanthes]|uniref:MBD domain-containing protein n=1 Tax=Dichanthelium oligosanthes TaxID=888268 RepID=A0A1E5WKZ0_9POAL|nr:hypothetical protein BAE44_0000977 [Dichanthelium oligosanthes]
MGSSTAAPIVISDDHEEPVAPVATVPAGAEHEQQAVAAEGLLDDDDDDGIERPDWLPDGFEIEGYYVEDGSFKTTGYICPVSGLNLSMMSEVLDYCFSGAMDRGIAAKETLDDESTLQGMYAWLTGKPGWVLEIRAGGDNFSKMFKIIAQLEFSVNTLPPGWVKETAFRKCSNGIRKDSYYTDPITEKVFRSLKSAEQYFSSGGEPLGAHVPIMSVTDMYSFDSCTDMLPCLARRLKMEGAGDQGECHTSCSKYLWLFAKCMVEL